MKFPRLREYRVSELLEEYGISLQSRKPSITIEPCKYRVSELLEEYGISLQSRKPSITIEPCDLIKLLSRGVDFRIAELKSQS